MAKDGLPVHVMKFKKIIKGSKKCLVLIAQPLDLDCIASGILVKKYLESLKIFAEIYFPRKFTELNKETYKELPHFGEIKDTNNIKSIIQKGEYDTGIFLDGTSTIQFFNNSIDETETPDWEHIKKKIKIDHHKESNDLLEVDFAFCDEKASSTVEILLDTIIPIDILSEDLATIAYGGISSDTGNFSWNFTPKTLRITAKVLEKGANTDLYTDMFAFSKSRKYLDAMSYAIENTEYYEDINTQVLVLSQKEFEKIGDRGKINQIKNAFKSSIARKVKGYYRGFVLVEVNPTQIKISGRGNNYRNKLSIPEIYKKMGASGGGHIQSGGAEIYGNIGEIKQKLLETIRNELSS